MAVGDAMDPATQIGPEAIGAYQQFKSIYT
jgi:hypothetical protein